MYYHKSLTVYIGSSLLAARRSLLARYIFIASLKLVGTKSPLNSKTGRKNASDSLVLVQFYSAEKNRLYILQHYMVVVKSNHMHQTTMIDRTLNMVLARWYIQLSFELLFCASSKKYFTQSSSVCITLVNHNFKFSTSLSRAVENKPMS